MARRHLPRKYNRELPRLSEGASANLPRVYDLVLEFIAHTDAQLDAGLRGMSVPLIDRKGRCRAALGMTVTMPAYRSGAHMIEAVLPLLQETAQQMRPVL